KEGRGDRHPGAQALTRAAPVPAFSKRAGVGRSLSTLGENHAQETEVALDVIWNSARLRPRVARRVLLRAEARSATATARLVRRRSRLARGCTAKIGDHDELERSGLFLEAGALGGRENA